MGKDKIFGSVILVFGVLLMVFYVLWGPVALYYSNQNDGALLWGFLDWRWSIVVPATLAVVVFGLLAAWIGYSMITTPPPVPLEELEEELEAEEAASKTEEEVPEATSE